MKPEDQVQFDMSVLVQELAAVNEKVLDFDEENGLGYFSGETARTTRDAVESLRQMARVMRQGADEGLFSAAAEEELKDGLG